MTTAQAANPFALMVDPAQVKQHIDRSEELSKLSQRQCHPLDRAVIRCASAEIAAFDAKIDRTTNDFIGESSLVAHQVGRGGVLSKTLQGVQNCLNNKVFTGVCTSLCKTNIDDLLTEKWVDRLIEMGVMYTWFHVYRPMGPNPNVDLCLTPEQSRRARQFVVEMRAKKPIVIVDAYYDGEGKALCPAVTGISHHINPWGDIEPCPIVQFSKESIHSSEADGRTLKDKFVQSAFLADFRKLAAEMQTGRSAPPASSA